VPICGAPLLEFLSVVVNQIGQIIRSNAHKPIAYSNDWQITSLDESMKLSVGNMKAFGGFSDSQKAG
jgi:hypothetical protein